MDIRKTPKPKEAFTTVMRDLAVYEIKQLGSDIAETVTDAKDVAVCVVRKAADTARRVKSAIEQKK